MPATKIGIMRLGEIGLDLLRSLQESLGIEFPGTEVEIVHQGASVPIKSLDTSRRQHFSDIVLEAVRNFDRNGSFDRILGVADVDLFVPKLSFVFGQADCPGKAALISLYRLKPEFYGRPSNSQLTLERSIKEAAHELGHTLGLEHCANPFCVMHFSNSITETDVKKSFFCRKCHTTATALISEPRRKQRASV